MDNKVNNVVEEKVNTTGYKVTIGILITVIAVLVWTLLYSREEIKTVEIQKEEIRMDLTGELDSLMVQHNEVKKDYGELSEQASQKDSIIDANAKEIKKLIAKSSDYRQIKRKLTYLRKIHQSYIDQLDSIYTENHKLKEDLQLANETINKTTKKADMLAAEKDQLSQIVETGAVLRAYNVKGTTFSLKGKTMREKETFKARRVDRVKIRFTVGENPLAEPGKRFAYVRIARPDGLIISEGKGDEFSFMAGETRLQYSLKQDIDYQNKSINIELNWDKKSDTPAMDGTYHVAIYVDGNQIGQSSFTLE